MDSQLSQGLNVKVNATDETGIWIRLTNSIIYTDNHYATSTSFKKSKGDNSYYDYYNIINYIYILPPLIMLFTHSKIIISSLWYKYTMYVYLNEIIYEFDNWMMSTLFAIMMRKNV